MALLVVSNVPSAIALIEAAVFKASEPVSFEAANPILPRMLPFVTAGSDDCKLIEYINYDPLQSKLW